MKENEAISHFPKWSRKYKQRMRWLAHGACATFNQADFKSYVFKNNHIFARGRTIKTLVQPLPHIKKIGTQHQRKVLWSCGLTVNANSDASWVIVT